MKQHKFVRLAKAHGYRLNMNYEHITFNFGKRRSKGKEKCRMTERHLKLKRVKIHKIVVEVQVQVSHNKITYIFKGKVCYKISSKIIYCVTEISTKLKCLKPIH